MTVFKIPESALRRREQRILIWKDEAATYTPEEQAWLLENFVNPALELEPGDPRRVSLAHECVVMHSMKAHFDVNLCPEQLALGDAEGAAEAAPDGAHGKQEEL